MKKLNIPNSTLDFIKDYLNNQNEAQTVVRDQFGTYISKDTVMSRGTVQGQIGADLCFTIQQMCLRELENVHRTTYVDDINDIITGKSASEVIDTIRCNESRLGHQSKTIGFKLNSDKTEYINFNVKDKDMRDLKSTRTSKLLGLPFIANNKGVNFKPSIDMICNRLNKNMRKIHTLRSFVTDIDTLVRVARCLVYQSIGELHIICGYTNNLGQNESLDDLKIPHEIQVAVNKCLRATGLLITTPQTCLDIVLGTSLQNFVFQQIIMTGLKNLGPNFSECLDRTFNFRSPYVIGTYMHTFSKLWNSSHLEFKLHVIKLKKFSLIKNFIKERRKLSFQDSIYTTYTGCLF